MNNGLKRYPMEPYTIQMAAEVTGFTRRQIIDWQSRMYAALGTYINKSLDGEEWAKRYCAHFIGVAHNNGPVFIVRDYGDPKIADYFACATDEQGIVWDIHALVMGFRASEDGFIGLI